MIDDYMTTISKKCECVITASNKVSNEDLKIPTIKNYNIFYYFVN